MFLQEKEIVELLKEGNDYKNILPTSPEFVPEKLIAFAAKRISNKALVTTISKLSVTEDKENEFNTTGNHIKLKNGEKKVDAGESAIKSIEETWNTHNEFSSTKSIYFSVATLLKWLHECKAGQNSMEYVLRFYFAVDKFNNEKINKEEKRMTLITRLMKIVKDKNNSTSGKINYKLEHVKEGANPINTGSDAVAYNVGSTCPPECGKADEQFNP